MIIEDARTVDIDQVVRVHIAAFPRFFLSSLGPAFLSELYSGFLAHPSGIFLVVRRDGSIIGFAAGTSEPEVFFAHLRRSRWPAFLFKAIPAILRNPLPVCRKLLYALKYRGESPFVTSGGALLSSIGMTSESRGTGIAGTLIARFEEKARSRGSRFVYLTTDVDENERVNKFYEKNGYAVDGQFKQSSKRTMFRYIKQL